ncbi:MAG: hypothetical protein NC078_04555 [Ruminococcus sp.]|nr:hypothetical protein [Ruminococcus sp.]
MKRSITAGGCGGEKFRQADISAKVFSPVYEVKIDGREFDGGVIKSMRLVKEAESMPVKGIVTSTLYLTLKTDIAFTPNCEINVNAGDMSFAPHYISRISRKGDLLSITACDMMRRLENPFDDALYNEKSEPFNASLLISDLAHQCGFEGCENLPGEFGKFYFGDIHNRTCREILNLVSEYAVGTFCCKNNGVLRFDRFLTYSSAVGVRWENSARLYYHSAKGPFKAVYGKNTASGEVYKAGNSGSFTNVLKISSRLLDGKRVSEIMTSVVNKKFQSYYCGRMDIMAAPDGLTTFITEGGGELISVKTEVIFGGGGVYGKAKAADICEDESEFPEMRDYEMKKKIEEYRQYGSVVMTDKGLGIAEDIPEENNAEKSLDIRERKTYYFSKAEGDVTRFDGVIMDGKMPDRIEKVSENCRRIVYKDKGYLLKFKRNSDGSRSDISLEREE